jgi:hypothetical protein
MIHWQRRKKIKAALKAHDENPRRKVALSDKKIADLLAYVKRYFKETRGSPGKFPASSIAAEGVKSKAYFSSYKDMDIYIKENRKWLFTKYLTERLEEREMTVKDLYKLAGFHRSIKQKIELSSDIDPYQPDKDTVIKMGIAMQMNFEEMNKLLDAAGFSLARNDRKDLVIRYCINEKIYDRVEVDWRVIEATGKSIYKTRKDNYAD